MAHVSFLPPYGAWPLAAAQLRAQGWSLLRAHDVAEGCGVAMPDLQALHADWADLPADDYLKDGGRYRYRRHACFVARQGQLHLQPHRAHWQPVEYNALHGGMERWFAPMHAHTVAQPAWRALLLGLAGLCDSVFEPASWFIEAHQFRIDTAGGLGRPTPEGAHRDGVDLVAVFLLQRHGIKGGETRIFEARGPAGQRFTLTEPWSVLLLDDARMIHETTPIQPLHEGAAGWRDTLVLTCRRGGFQGAPA